MSRLILSGFLNRVLIPQTSRLIQKPSTHPMVPFRFLASYGKDLPPVDPKEVELRVFKSLSTHDKIEPQNVKISSHLTNDLGLDSLDHVEIMVALEDEFDINIEDVDAEKIHTVKDIVDFIVKYLQNKPDPRQNPGAKYDPNMDFGPQ